MKQVNAVETSKGGGNPAIAHSSVQFRTLSCAPPTSFSWVSEGSQCCLPHLDFLYKVVYSSANYSKSGH